MGGGVLLDCTFHIHFTYISQQFHNLLLTPKTSSFIRVTFPSCKICKGIGLNSSSCDSIDST